MPEPQAKDLRKLLLVPVLALRDLCLSKPHPDETSEAIARKTQNDLLKYVQDSDQFSQVEIDALYEKFRYGRRISLQLFLTPEAHILPENANAIYSVFSSELEALDEDASEAEATNREADDKQGTEPTEQRAEIQKLRALDVERFGELTEFRYKYQMPITYLNEDENVDHVYETRYGFIWINLQQKFVVLLSRDEQINETLISALRKALKTSPSQVRLPREVINEHFEMEKIRRANYRDPERHINRSISGESGLWDTCSEELEQHEADSIREGALYDEKINPRLTSGIGLTQRKGKFYFTRILSASDLRHWAERRLPNFVRDVREWSHKNRSIFGVPSRANASSTEKYYREQIVISLMSMRRDGIDEIEIDTDFAELAAEVSPIRLGLSLSLECETCGHAATECPGCRSQKAKCVGKEFVCDECDRVLVVGNLLNLMCADGHLQEGDVGTAISLFPKRGMIDQVTKEMDAAGLEWDRSTDTFLLYDQKIRLQKKPPKGRRGDTNYIISGGQQAVVGHNASARGFSQKEAA